MLKKLLTLTMFALIGPAYADKAIDDNKSQLQSKIKQLTTFAADFKQKVIDVDGKPVMEGKGTVQLSHPSLIRWHAMEPDENLMISDGKTLWIYNIDLEQVTAADAKRAIDSTPFALLASTDEQLWANYTVSRQGEAYVILPKEPSGQVAKLMVFFDQDKFSKLVIEDVSKQKSEFTFVKVKTNQSVAKSQFLFTVPEGVELDDQRQ